MNSVLEANNLGYATPDGKLLQSALSFSVRGGEMLLIRGPNGSGKSTLLKTILGIFPPVEGTVSCAVPQRKWHYIPQLENTEVHLPFTLRDVLTISHGRVATEQLAGYRLISDDQLDNAWNTASGGERKRVLLTRALLSTPQILILDEPMNHLDKLSRDAMIESMAGFLRAGDETKPRAIIMVCHQGLSQEESSKFRLNTLSLSLRVGAKWGDVSC